MQSQTPGAVINLGAICITFGLDRYKNIQPKGVNIFSVFVKPPSQCFQQSTHGLLHYLKFLFPHHGLPAGFHLFGMLNGTP